MNRAMAQNTHTILNQLLAAYARCIDDGDLTAWPDFFEEQCLYKITSAENYERGLEAGIVFANSRAMLSDRISSLREANIHERHTYRHFLGQPWIAEQNGDEVRSETSFFVMRIMRDGMTDIYATGRYLDKIKLNGSSAKLAERIVVCDSSRFDTLLALPL
jgi:anthranilate 1,2-dioxygenase small subunit